jgi:formate dehydrogenase (coenzyme F420) beta subunit
VDNIENILREEARKLLGDKKVDVLVGYEKGTVPLIAAPCFITDAAEVDRLVWNSECIQNLAKFAHDIITQHKESQKRVKPEDRKKKIVGIVARGCTTRSLVIHLQEKQYDRDDLVIMGVPCTGYVDKKKVAALLNDEDIIEASVIGDSLSVRTAGSEKKLALKDVLADNCITCRFNDPVVCDVMIGVKAPAMNADGEYLKVEEFEKLSAEERWTFFTKEMAKCIRCAACRQACPSCYCRICFAEQSQPQWVGISEESTDTQVFQIMRMFHMVGRCVDCGTCNAVCPMGVDLRKFLKKLDKDALELFNHRAGIKIEEPAPLATFRDNDKEDFIFNPGGGGH